MTNIELAKKLLEYPEMDVRAEDPEGGTYRINIVEIKRYYHSGDEFILLMEE